MGTTTGPGMSMEVTPESSPDRRWLRSRITNHRALLPHLDGRSAGARRFRDLVRAFVADMGGIEELSEIKLGLLRRLAAMTVLAEQVESRMADGEEINIAELCQLSSTAMRLSSRLGIERVPRDVSRPNLREYLDARHSSDEAQS